MIIPPSASFLGHSTTDMLDRLVVLGIEDVASESKSVKVHKVSSRTSSRVLDLTRIQPIIGFALRIQEGSAVLCEVSVTL